MIFKIAIILFALFAIARTYGQYQRKLVSRYWLWAFSLLWLALVGAALWPRITDDIAHAVGISRGADMLVYMSVIALLYSSYRLIVKTQKTSDEITELVRQIAISEAKPPKLSDPGNL